MKDRWTRRRVLKDLLLQATECELQHTGWPCNSCFHALKLGVSEDLLHRFWEATLVLRGDYRASPHVMFRADCIFMPDGDLDRLVTRLTDLLEKHQQRALFS